jgi:DNA-binding protein Fis
VLTLDSLPENLRSSAGNARGRSLASEVLTAGLGDFTQGLLLEGEANVYHRVCTEVDRVVLDAALRHARGNQVKASELLGISRTTLRAKLRALKSEKSKGKQPNKEKKV